MDDFKLDELFDAKLFDDCIPLIEHQVIVERVRLIVMDYEDKLVQIGEAIKVNAGNQWRAPLAVGLVYAAWNSVKGFKISYKDCANHFGICGGSTLRKYN
jgi:hypothetical protein